MIPRIVLGAFLLVAFVPGCSDDTTAPKQDSFPTSPEQVVERLQTAYRSRDAEAYTSLLAPEFTFVFQADDAEAIGTDTWTKAQDVTGTTALFNAEVISDVSIQLFYDPSEPAGDGFPASARRIQITQTELQVDQTDAVTWMVETHQDMYLRPGGDGEDPDRWFLIEWRDLHTLEAHGVTWGHLKTVFLP